MKAQLPPSVPMIEMSFSGTRPRDQIAGIIAEMHLIQALSTFADRDPGKPNVPEFGRAIHYLNLPDFIPSTIIQHDRGETAKFAVLGAQWPSLKRKGYMHRALDEFEGQLFGQSFRSVVFDYDGTLSGSRSVDSPPPQSVLEHLRRLVDAGIFVGIASGRGGSIQEIISKHLPDIADKIHLGLYNGGWISPANLPPERSDEVSEFLSHVLRIVGRLKTLGVPIADIRPTQPYQVSIRLSPGCKPEEIWLVIADSLRQAGLDFSRAVKSKHSVDVLAPGVGKSRLIAHLIETFSIDPYEILAVGDQGAWPGNDAELLEHRFSLSVDEPSRRLDRGWKLAPSEKRDVDATLWYLERIRFDGAGRFTIGPFERGVQA
jgi:hydroxymethylpyrimidine pyrophosphatase-like HAD family hydrolase